MSAAGVTLYPLDGMGLLAFDGEDAQSFLQAQLSCDVSTVASGTSTYGSYCTPQGRMLATFLLWSSGGRYFMQLPDSLCAPIRRRLSMYILRAKVKADDASGNHALFGVAGDGAARTIEAVFGGGVPAGAYDTRHVNESTVIRLAPDRFELALPAASVATVREALLGHAEEGTAVAWQRLDVHAGIPWIAPATREQFVPQMVNLDLIGGVSFAKGCYPGQEIVARAHYRGQVKQRMYRAHIATDDAVQAGNRLYSADMPGQSTGMVVNAVPAEKQGCDVLAVIQKSSVEAGDVHLKSLDGPVLELQPLPYAVP
ncbi:MAG: CAF17-like 4Fe-4S cluster assembly/insertion protein YgfZ [Betaproteobacteria bacterium]